LITANEAKRNCMRVAEFGLVVPQGLSHVCGKVPELIEDVFPCSFTPWTWNTFLARSMPTVAIFMVDAPVRFKWLT